MLPGSRVPADFYTYRTLKGEYCNEVRSSWPSGLVLVSPPRTVLRGGRPVGHVGGRASG